MSNVPELTAVVVVVVEFFCYSPKKRHPGNKRRNTFPCSANRNLLNNIVVSRLELYVHTHGKWAVTAGWNGCHCSNPVPQQQRQSRPVVPNGIPTVINNYPPAHLLFFLNLPFELIFKLFDENFLLFENVESCSVKWKCIECRYSLIRNNIHTHTELL